jgi:hypothetical protein
MMVRLDLDREYLSLVRLEDFLDLLELREEWLLFLANRVSADFLPFTLWPLPLEEPRRAAPVFFRLLGREARDGFPNREA